SFAPRPISESVRNRHRIRPDRGQLLARFVALSRIVLLPRVAGHPRPLQADGHRLRLGNYSAPGDDARVDDRLQSSGPLAFTWRSALRTPRVRSHVALAILFNSLGRVEQ